MRNRLAIGLTAIALATGVTNAAPTSMVQNQPETSAPQVAAVEKSSGGSMKWLTKWWRKPAKPEVTAVAVAPPSYQPAIPNAVPTGIPAMAAAPVRLPAPSYVASSPAAPAQPFVTATVSPAAPNGSTVDAVLAEARAAEAAGQVELARQMLTGCAELNPGNCLVRRRLGHLEDRAGQLTSAEQHYRQAIACDPTSAAAVNDLALCLARQSRFEESASVFGLAITMRPDKPLYRNNLATVLVHLGRIDEALDNLRSCNEPAVASYNLGHLLLKANQQAAAAEQFQQALAIDATMVPARSALERLAIPTGVGPEEQWGQTPQASPVAVTPAAMPVEQAQPRVAAAPATSPVPSAGFPRLLPPVIER